MCFRRSKRYLYWRTKTWIDLFEILLAHAEMRIAEISKEKYEFSKSVHFQSNILKQPWKILMQIHVRQKVETLKFLTHKDMDPYHTYPVLSCSNKDGRNFDY